MEQLQFVMTMPRVMEANIRGQAVKRDLSELPAQALAHIFSYGFQRVNNDAGAVGKGESTEVAVAKADKRWATFVSGAIRTTSGRETDPVASEAMKIALAAIKRQVSSDVFKALSATEIKLKAKAVIEANPKILEVAQANVEARKALDVSIDLD